jgi:DNA-binding response OmpR family regulator
LIAEADANLCGAYERMFAGSGLLVETAVDGLDCWFKLQARCPDALMIDMDLLWGGSDGVLARLREDSDQAVNPEVFVTGDEPPDVLSIRAGVALGRCFQKPLEMRTVLNSICDVFSSDAEITLLGVRV